MIYSFKHDWIFFRSVLAVLFRTNKLSLYIADKRSLYGWFEILDLTTKHVQEMKEGKYFKGEYCPLNYPIKKLIFFM